MSYHRNLREQLAHCRRTGVTTVIAFNKYRIPRRLTAGGWARRVLERYEFRSTIEFSYWGGIVVKRWILVDRRAVP